MLNPVASRMWRVVAGDAHWPETRANILGEFECEAAALDADWEDFRRHCAERGWITEIEGDVTHGVQFRKPISLFPARSPLRAFSAVKILYRFRRLLTRGQFRHVYEQCAMTEVSPVSVPLRSLIRSFGRAESLFFNRVGPDDCLVRSLALYRFLRTHGVACAHKIGVRRQPFLAHAWVEYDGGILLDERGVSRHLIPIATLA